MTQNIALLGRARSGKDTVAARLVERHGFTRVAFADPLKRMAETVSPFVPTSPGVVVQLAPLIRDVGWEYAKDRYPEVRRLLQWIGHTVRDLDPEFWVRVALHSVEAAPGPVVVTDVRYPNEAEALRARGFRMVRVVRPGQDLVSSHVSETALDRYPPDLRVLNDGTLDDLRERADGLAA
jgi:hypothetical protein